ncbi:MAG TPA: hypothetical protein DD706_05560 [Nitrospiraceae bacterium]|nr:hypothetical protein [Nitrospiraceae bacterium]
MSETPYTMTVGELLDYLKNVPPDTDLFFGNGDLSFYRTEWRGDKFLQIEFNQVYTVEIDAPNG